MHDKLHAYFVLLILPDFPSLSLTMVEFRFRGKKNLHPPTLTPRGFNNPLQPCNLVVKCDVPTIIYK